jgi:hypothetical protein
MRWLGTVVDLEDYSTLLMGSMILVLDLSSLMPAKMLVMRCFRLLAV